jgi:hypothetical protein
VSAEEGDRTLMRTEAGLATSQEAAISPIEPAFFLKEVVPTLFTGYLHDLRFSSPFLPASRGTKNQLPFDLDAAFSALIFSMLSPPSDATRCRTEFAGLPVFENRWHTRELFVALQAYP